ncbi:homoserine dehydrogenase [Thioalkalivibrio sp. HK1]|uniref:homoserine dehydrogenase n=1 Tax=Thioalkalivibrio sp. HK1 TaxID=1469245 RepID=UPI0004722F16|nr:homoserine dehydrogenase [Thioalkalivibrio sp. HK1]
MQPVRIGLLGLGTVGGGTVNVLARNAEEIARRAGRAIVVEQAAVRSMERNRICSLDDIALTTDPEAVVRNPEIDVIVELIGGTEPARSLVLTAIDHGKHVVSANKALIATHGNEIFGAAGEKGVMVAFEAAVAGGIPIIKTLREGLSGNRIEWLAGIINGTSNFILTRMREKGASFAEALAEAQELGYAEADPTFDIKGVDAAHKLSILAAIAFGMPIDFDRVHTEGIDDITTEDIGYAEQLGYRIKHLGIARRSDEGVEMRVHPTLVPERDLLANVNDVMNAVLIKGDAVGRTLLNGAGAGAEPTASAVVADLVDVVRTLTTDPNHRVPHLAFQPDALTPMPLLPIEEARTSFYLKMLASDRPGVLADIAKILGESGISIEAVVQPEPPKGASLAKLVMLTHRVREGQVRAAVAKVEALQVIEGSVTSIRMERLDD